MLGLTPDLTARELPPVAQQQAAAQELDFRRGNFWRSCCGLIVDKRSLQYGVQVCISVGVAAFCMVKISTTSRGTCTGDDPTVYFSLLSAIVGYYVPGPRLAP